MPEELRGSGFMQKQPLVRASVLACSSSEKAPVAALPTCAVWCTL